MSTAANATTQLTLSEADKDSIADKVSLRITEAAVAKDGAKTKHQGGENLTAECFAYVGDPEKTETWKLPIKFSTEAKTVRHIRNALARFEQTKGIPADEKPKVKAKIVAAAKKHGIEVSEDGKSAKMAAQVFGAIQFLKDESLPVAVREAAIESAKSYKPDLTPEAIDEDARKALRVFKQLRPAEFSKSLWDVASVADCLNALSWTHWSLQWEKETEGDASDVPNNLADVIRDLVFVFQQLATEESNELVEALRGQEENKTKTEGAKTMKIDEKDLAKAHSAATKVENIKKAATEHFEAHGSPGSGMHKDAMDAVHGHCDKALGALKAVIGGDLEKASTVAGHIEKAAEASKAYCGKVCKAMEGHGGDMEEKCASAMKAIGTDESVPGAASGPGAEDEEEKAAAIKAAAAANVTAETAQKATLESFQKMLTDSLAPLTKSLEDFGKRLKVVEETPAATGSTPQARSNIFAVNRPENKDAAGKGTKSVFSKVDPAAQPGGNDMPSFEAIAASPQAS